MTQLIKRRSGKKVAFLSADWLTAGIMTEKGDRKKSNLDRMNDEQKKKIDDK